MKIQRFSVIWLLTTLISREKLHNENSQIFLAPKNTMLAMLVILFADKTIKLWKVSERDKKAEGYNLKEDSGLLRDPSTINTLRVSESSFLSSADEVIYMIIGGL